MEIESSGGDGGTKYKLHFGILLWRRALLWDSDTKEYKRTLESSCGK